MYIVSRSYEDVGGVEVLITAHETKDNAIKAFKECITEYRDLLMQSPLSSKQMDEYVKNMKYPNDDEHDDGNETVIEVFKLTPEEVYSLYSFGA